MFEIHLWGGLCEWFVLGVVRMGVLVISDWWCFVTLLACCCGVWCVVGVYSTVRWNSVLCLWDFWVVDFIVSGWLGKCSIYVE